MDSRLWVIGLNYQIWGPPAFEKITKEVREGESLATGHFA